MKADRAPGTLGRAILLCLLLVSCADRSGTPEERVRSLIDRAEAAAEEKDLSALKAMVDEGYSDERGNDRTSLIAMVRYHFLRNEALHFLVRVSSVSFSETGRAEVLLFVAMAGEPIPSAEEIDPLRADLYRFDLTFAEAPPGEWKLRSGSWRPAGAGDLL